MQVETELAEQSSDKEMLITIGSFDGVHLGHKYLISKLIDIAKQQNILSGVVTFRQHPQDLLKTKKKLLLLADLDTRVSLLKNEGVDSVVTLSFTEELSQLSARKFIELLKKYLKMRGLVIGTDFALGKNREGDITTLRKLGDDMDFTVTVVPPYKLNGEVVSSTTIRNALAKGDMKRVANLTGRSFDLHGMVAAGDKRGIELGFPTANLQVGINQATPPDGVYATWAHINGKVYKSMTNIGKRPTFGNNERTIEIYILEYQGNLYGNKMSIDIVDRLRDEKKFNSAEELKSQITKDIEQGTAILKSRGSN
jgi:riboflavin kinase/FMN adenylyltransferase